MTIDACRAEDQGRARPVVATVLAYAAAPAFAVMSVLTVLPADAAPTTCLGGSESSFLGGMAWMYLMMSVVHLPPWLKLLARLEAADRRA